MIKVNRNPQVEVEGEQNARNEQNEQNPILNIKIRIKIKSDLDRILIKGV